MGARPTCGGLRLPVLASATGVHKTAAHGVLLGWRSRSTPQGGGAPGQSVEARWLRSFSCALSHGAFPVVESSGSSGRYPKMWDLPWWREILARPDVQFVEFPMCAFGLGPPDGDGYYHHRTRVAFPRCEALASALSRCCPGVGASHRHVPLAGVRPGAPRSRCAEAGV